MRGLSPSTGIICVAAMVLAGCQGTGSIQPEADSDSGVVRGAGDVYALSPPPDLILPRDEPITGTEHTYAANETPDGSPGTTGDLWMRMRAGFSLASERPEVRDSARRLAKGRRHLNDTLLRGEPYLWHLVREVEARGMPMEIALLPAIESAYNPFAYSPSAAVGLWQFLSSTATRFGLRRNWWYDGRRDVTESTRAALDYLAYLHDMFDDWLLALAAYNSGEGRVQQAQQYNRARGLAEDFWSISLPAETRGYVPRLLGLSELVAHPERYGYELQPLSDDPRFEVVELPGQIEMELAAGLIDVDPKALQALNPGFSRWATDPQGPHRLLVPYGQGGKLRERLMVLPQDKLVRWLRYVAEEGDSLSTIAHRYGVQPAVLQEVNRIQGNTLMAGTELRIPRAFAREVPLPPEPIQSAALNRITYTIRPGDSLWSIARQHGVRLHDLMRWNNLSSSATLRPGRTLVIHGGPKTTDT